MANSGDKSDKILAGIQLTLAEIRDLRVETRDIRGEIRDLRTDFRAAMERADEDRRKADEDRRRSDERFQLLIKRSDRQFRDLVRGVVQVGREIRDTQHKHTELLQAILKTLRTGFNGKPTNGSK